MFPADELVSVEVEVCLVLGDREGEEGRGPVPNEDRLGEWGQQELRCGPPEGLWHYSSGGGKQWGGLERQRDVARLEM